MAKDKITLAALNEKLDDFMTSQNAKMAELEGRVNRRLGTVEEKQGLAPKGYWRRFSEWRAGTYWDNVIFAILVTALVQHWMVANGKWIYKGMCHVIGG